MKISPNQGTSPTSHSKRKFRRTTRILFAPLFAMFALVVAFSALAQEGGGRFNRVWGERYKPAKQTQPQSTPRELFNLKRGGNTMRRLMHWNEVSINASGLDHTPVPVGDPRIFGEQLGPGRSARAMAIVHIAMFDAINAIEGGYRSYTGIPRVLEQTSVDSAMLSQPTIR